MPPMTTENILVIKLGALGDFIQATGAMQAIRAHHPNAHITLLTTSPFQKFGTDCGYFDEIWVDDKPKWYEPHKWITLRSHLNKGHFTRVYDLQNNDRTSFYFRLFSPRPEWVGVAKGASHQNTSPDRTKGHAFYGHAQTLKSAGIQNVEIDTLSWIKSDLKQFDTGSPYILFVPGSAPTRPEKRWGAENYAKLGMALSAKGYRIFLIGTAAEAAVTSTIKKLCPAAEDLTGQTNLNDIVELGRVAALSVGNDTGPMHMIAPTGCPCLTLFSQHSNPDRHYPLGPNSVVLYAADFKDIGLTRILQAIRDDLKLDLDHLEKPG